MDSSKHEPIRPFKHVEVVDVRTGTACKVACMACIRGHRATTCGNNSSCQSKIFWTVKRPGRPSHACTCRLGARGRCECHIATPSCPHKIKGTKRSVECRCEESGRFCCFIERQQWKELFAGRSPHVVFYPSTDDLITAHPASQAVTPPVSAATSQTLSSLPSTPEAPTTASNLNSYVDIYAQPHIPSGKIPRLGMMGVGLPWGDDESTPRDVLQWQGELPILPHDIPLGQPIDVLNTPPMDRVQHTPDVRTLRPSFLSLDSNHAIHNPAFPATTSLPDHFILEAMPDIINSMTEIDRIMADFTHHTFPDVICQKCGLSGCTCRDCPAVMQNTVNGSWGTGCLKKHAKEDVFAEATAAPSSCCGGASKDATDAVQQHAAVHIDKPIQAHALPSEGLQDLSLMSSFTIDEDFDLGADDGCCCGGEGGGGCGGCGCGCDCNDGINATTLDDLFEDYNETDAMEGVVADSCCGGGAAPESDAGIAGG